MVCIRCEVFAYMQGVQLDTEQKAEWSQSVRVDAKQQLNWIVLYLDTERKAEWSRR